MKSKIMMEWIWKLLLLGAIAYAFLCAYIYFMQPGMIYYPNMPGRSIESTPESIGLEYQDIKFITDDGIKLHGWFIPAKASTKTMLFFHGNAGNISHRLESIALFHQLDLNVFIIDYRGYGLSGGKPTEKGTYRDAEAAWRFLTEKRGVKEEEIIIFGRSLGGSIAAWLASQHTPAALIVESSFTSIPAIGKIFYPYLPVRWISRFQYDTEKAIKKLNCPVLIAHSHSDEIIPYKEGLKLFSSALEPKRFIELRGGHNNSVLASGTAYKDGIKSFIDSYIHETGTNKQKYRQ